MTAITDRALAAIEAIKGNPFTGARAIEIARDFVNDTGDTLTNDQLAEQFLGNLLQHVKVVVKNNRQAEAAALNDAAETQAGDDAVTDL